MSIAIEWVCVWELTNRTRTNPRLSGQLVEHYFKHHHFKNLGTRKKDHRNINRYLIPRWGTQIATKIRSKEVEKWLLSYSKERVGENGLSIETLKTLKAKMSAIFNFAAREELIPQELSPNSKGVFRSWNPVTAVKIEGVSDYEPFVFTTEQTLKILLQVAAARTS